MLLVSAPINFVENNGNWEVHGGNGEYLGLITKNPNDSRLMDPGKWFLSLYGEDEALYGYGPFETLDDAKAEVLAHVELV
ncbi:hypothetical protein A2955_05005 [Candidatus Woesebacteria bacterium RIFCSPLOWO2_01_FULL_37_19]|uniref:Uncharacterized protein n=1 Tax=Candidatus Woesebacteria bacterium RIFCSPLOWO2_01_FULL_37_19 TaxID=1802514 RepID=A0A1F8B042_9BACT|nr:MAG: hypothetical protein A2955_05005 [Candidatus Woesebacteria bacterium RIFCSPLOWO2_01_FULL_37_19]